jgi:hypothetical protein
MRRASLLVVLAACGRIAFDPHGPSDATGSGIGADGHDAPGGMSGDASGDGGGSASGITTIREGTNSGNTSMQFLMAVLLNAGDTLIVSMNQAATTTASVNWNGIPLQRVAGPVTCGNNSVTLWTYTTATAGAGNLIAMTATGSHPSDMIVTIATGLVASPFDQVHVASGGGTMADTGATPPTTSPNELVYAVVAGDAGSALGGTWSAGSTASQTVTGNVDESADAVAITSATGSFDVMLSGIPNQNWCAIVATFAGP